MAEDNWVIATGLPSDDIASNMERLGISKDDEKLQGIIQHFANEAEKFKKNDAEGLKRQHQEEKQQHAELGAKV